jgi:hypothetical protein
MIIKWYNRDEFSDRDMAQAKSVSNRLIGKNVVEPFGWEPAPQWAKDAKDDDLRREE